MGYSVVCLSHTYSIERRKYHIEKMVRFIKVRKVGDKNYQNSKRL